MLRWAAISLSSTVLLVILAANTAGALNFYQDAFVQLSARPLGMGGAAVAVPQPASVFHNPAALSGVRTLSIMWNHSARHFGHSRDTGHERDHLDGDTESIVVPLPLTVYAHGFTAAGELGYDYRNHPADGSLGYPREFLTGTESYDAIATSFGLPLALGYAIRRSQHRFEPDPDDPLTPEWLRLGEGEFWGLYARVLPSLDYGYSELKHTYDWTVLAKGEDGAAFLPMFSRIKTKRSGYAFRPAGWLLLAADQADEQYTLRDASVGFDDETEERVYFDADRLYGAVHSGEQSRQRSHSGGELRIGWLAALRWGSWDGRPTTGVSLGLGALTLNYAEVRDLLPELIGAAGNGWHGVHIYGAELGLW